MMAVAGWSTPDCWRICLILTPFGNKFSLERSGTAGWSDHMGIFFPWDRARLFSPSWLFFPMIGATWLFSEAGDDDRQDHGSTSLHRQMEPWSWRNKLASYCFDVLACLHV
jgi:hypothetical protein